MPAACRRRTGRLLESPPEPVRRPGDRQGEVGAAEAESPVNPPLEDVISFFVAADETA